MSPDQPGTPKLLNVLGVTFGLSVGIGSMVGVGALRVPGAVAQSFPDFWPFMAVWLTGGLYALLGTNALAELGTAVPRSGGPYVFVRRGLGDLPGFVVGWSDWMGTCAVLAATAIVLGEYAVGIFPALRTHQVVALAVVAFLTILQWIGVRWGAVAQTITTVVKLLALLALVMACFSLGSRNPVSALVSTDRDGSLLLASVVALQAVIFAYHGWAAPAYFAEETRQPGRTLPRAMLGGVLGVIALYLVLNAAFAAVVPIPTLAGKDDAAGAVAHQLFGLHGGPALRVIMALVLISAANAAVMMAPRVIMAMGSDGLFWRAATQVNSGGTPDVALLASTIVAAVFIVTGTFEQAVAKLAFFFVAAHALSFLSVFALRRREPDLARPYRAWGHPWTTALALAASIVFLLAACAASPRDAVWAAVLFFLSWPAYLLVRR